MPSECAWTAAGGATSATATAAALVAKRHEAIPAIRGTINRASAAERWRKTYPSVPALTITIRISVAIT